jgi:hypothetical protein
MGMNTQMNDDDYELAEDLLLGVHGQPLRLTFIDVP